MLQSTPSTPSHRGGLDEEPHTPYASHTQSFSPGKTQSESAIIEPSSSSSNTSTSVVKQQLESCDELDKDSRVFYERAKVKLSWSIYWAAWALVCIGFTSICAANNEAYTQYGDYADKHLGKSDDLIQQSYYYKGSGWGFAAFSLTVASIIMFAISIWMSPLRDSPDEKAVLKTLQQPRFGPDPNAPKIENKVEVGNKSIEVGGEGGGGEDSQMMLES